MVKNKGGRPAALSPKAQVFCRKLRRKGATQAMIVTMVALEFGVIVDIRTIRRYLKGTKKGKIKHE